MTASAPSGQHDLVSCRACGATLGVLNRQHDRVTLLPGVPTCREIDGGCGVLCPSCGEYRLLWAGRAFREKEEVMKPSRAPP